MKDCPHCLKRNVNNVSNCWHCGKRLDEEPIRPLMQIKKCPSCGEENQKGAFFCRFCHYDLSDTTPTDSLRAIEKSTIQEPDEATNQITGEEEEGDKYAFKTMSEDFIIVGLMLYGLDTLLGYIVTLMSDIKWVSPDPPSQVIGSYIFAIIPSQWLARKITKHRTAYMLLTVAFSEVFLIAIGLIWAVITILFYSK